MRWFTCFLVALSGLVFTSPAFAATFSTQSAAHEACISAADSRSGNIVAGKCVYKNLTPYTYGGTTRYGAYTCVHHVVSSPTQSSVRYCNSTSAVRTCSGSTVQQACTDEYNNYQIPSSVTTVMSVAGSSAYFIWNTAKTCDTSITFNVDFADGDTAVGSLENVCADYCRYTGTPSWVGTYPQGVLRYTYKALGAECSPQETDFDLPTDPDAEITPEDINTDQDGDGKKDGDDPCPNDPTDTCNIPDDSKDTDGDGKPDYQDPYPNDPTNGKGDGNGSGDGNTSSGGGDCITPPSCGGDPIQCNILFQSWAHRCGKTGGTAGEGPTSPGSPGGGGDGDNPWDGKLGEPGSTDLSGFTDDQEVDGSFLNSSGLGLSRSCPQIDTFDIHFFGSTKTIDFGDSFCEGTSWVGDFIALLGVFVGLMAFFRVK